MATIVYKAPNPDGHVGTLFAGHSFWLSANVPQRKRFQELIQINGGTIKLIEKEADIKLVDHAKRDNPLNTFSYKFVEKSIQNGQLEDPEHHRAGPMTRPVGAPRVPARGSRVPFSLEDDQILWDWMQPYEARKDQVAGNLIYQQLALQHPRHTFQSWRDRYLKRVRGHPRPGAAATESDSPEQESSQRDVSQASSSGHQSTSFTRASQNTAASKRKRQSYEGPSTVPSYEVDHEAKRKRRATDFIPRNDPSTPVQGHDAPGSRAQSTSQNAITDASQSDKYETAPQFPLPTGETQTQLTSLTPSQLEEEENFKAMMELPFPTATRPQDTKTTAGKEDEGIEEWIQERIENGQSGDHVLLALSCTSMDAELADRVLVLLSSGQKIPSDIPGVWTEQDDKDLLGEDGRAISRLNEKHGAELFQKRYDHLKNSAEATRLVAQEGL